MENKFYTPEFTKEEIKKYENLIIKKSSLTKKEVNTILATLFSKIEVIDLKEYQVHIPQARKEIADEKDVIFVALAVAKNTSIWSDDKDFNTVRSVKVYTTKDLIE